MKNLTQELSRAMLVGVLTTALFGGMTIVSTRVIAAEQAVVPEKNPPGDIPDSQVFVTYRSPMGFSLKVPEGWARTNRSDGASFADKYNTLDATVDSTPAAPTVMSVTTHEAKTLVTTGHAVKISMIKNIKLQSGPAILIAYSSNSEPNPVTNKQLRLENNRYLIYYGGKLATINLSAPLGADNVDQWRLMSNSFQWN